MSDTIDDINWHNENRRQCGVIRQAIADAGYILIPDMTDTQWELALNYLRHRIARARRDRASTAVFYADMERVTRDKLREELG